MRISDLSSVVCSSDLRRGLFEIRDVPNDLIYAMSRRAEQIDAHAKEHGPQGQAERSISFFAPRPPKQKVDLDTLHAPWAERSTAPIPATEAVRAAAEARGAKHLAADPTTARRAALCGIRNSETRQTANIHARLTRTEHHRVGKE